MPIFKIKKESIPLRGLVSYMIKNRISKRDLSGSDEDSGIFIKDGNVEIDYRIEKDPEALINTENITSIRFCPNTGFEESFTIK